MFGGKERKEKRKSMVKVDEDIKALLRNTLAIVKSLASTNYILITRDQLDSGNQIFCNRTHVRRFQIRTAGDQLKGNNPNL